jgi:hypothetical protein
MRRTGSLPRASVARPRQYVILALLVLLTGVPACERRSPEEQPRSDSAPSAPRPAGESPPPAPPAPARETRYGRIPIPDATALFALRDSLGKPAFHEVLKINRLDIQHVRAGDSLVVPEGFRDARAVDSLRHSPFPIAIPAVDSLSKFLLVSIRVQAFAAYERGRLVHWGPTSTGRRDTPTPVGLYHTNWKDKERTSTVNGEWLLTWYVNLDNLSGVSFHQYGLPGRPASHSCIRLLEEDARWLYDWAEQWQLTADGAGVLRNGTPVLIFGEYAYGRRPPWKKLPQSPDAATVTLREIEGALTAFPHLGVGPLASR